MDCKSCGATMTRSILENRADCPYCGSWASLKPAKSKYDSLLVEASRRALVDKQVQLTAEPRQRIGLVAEKIERWLGISRKRAARIFSQMKEVGLWEHSDEWVPGRKQYIVTVDTEAELEQKLQEAGL